MFFGLSTCKKEREETEKRRVQKKKKTKTKKKRIRRRRKKVGVHNNALPTKKTKTKNLPPFAPSKKVRPPSFNHYFFFKPFSVYPLEPFGETRVVRVSSEFSARLDPERDEDCEKVDVFKQKKAPTASSPTAWPSPTPWRSSSPSSFCSLSALSESRYGDDQIKKEKRTGVFFWRKKVGQTNATISDDKVVKSVISRP